MFFGILMEVLPFALHSPDELRGTNGNTSIEIPKNIPPALFS